MVEINNYPRFPADETQLVKSATEIGLLLMDVCDQQSFMVQSNTETTWYSRRKDLQDKTAQSSRDKSISGGVAL